MTRARTHRLVRTRSDRLRPIRRAILTDLSSEPCIHDLAPLMSGAIFLRPLIIWHGLDERKRRRKHADSVLGRIRFEPEEPASRTRSAMESLYKYLSTALPKPQATKRRLALSLTKGWSDARIFFSRDSVWWAQLGFEPMTVTALPFSAARSPTPPIQAPWSLDPTTADYAPNSTWAGSEHHR